MNDSSKSLIKKILGFILIVLGLLALLTPLTPGSWLIFVGLELFGIHLAAWEKIKSSWVKYKDNKKSEK